jgi:hypothetical protein
LYPINIHQPYPVVLLVWLVSSRYSRRTANHIWLVVEPPLWKIWKSVGMMTFSIYGKNTFQTTNQLLIIHCY